MKQIGLGYAELWDGQIRAEGPLADCRPGAPIRPWMKSAAFARSLTTRASISTLSTTAFATNSRDQQIEQGFLMAKAMGVTRITASANVDISPRVDKFAEQYKIYVGYHDHDSMKPNEFSTPDDWKTGAGRPFEIYGHQSRHRPFHRRGLRSGQLPRRAPRQDHDAAHQGSQEKSRPEHAAGRRATPISKACCEVLKTKKYPIPAMIEYEYGKPGMDTVAEVKKCFDYCKAALA